VPRCRCRARPSPSCPGPSAATGSRSGRPDGPEPRAAGPAGPGLPARGQDVCRGRGRVRDRDLDGLAVRERDRLPAGRPGTQAPPGRPGREQGRARLRDPRGTLIPVDRVAADRPFYSGKHQNKPQSQKDANKAHARLRSPGECANAQLKTWRVLRKLRCCPWRAGQLAKAIHVLQIREANAG
jgi:hypothetical protein